MRGVVLAADTPDGHGRDGPDPEDLQRRYEASQRAFEDSRRRYQEKEDDRQQREYVDRELDRDFYLSEIAGLREEIAQLRRQLRPLVKLTSELLQERYLRREED